MAAIRSSIRRPFAGMGLGAPSLLQTARNVGAVGRHSAGRRSALAAKLLYWRGNFAAKAAPAIWLAARLSVGMVSTAKRFQEPPRAHQAAGCQWCARPGRPRAPYGNGLL